MDLWRSLGGMIEVELTSAEPELALEEITARKIEIRRVRQKSPLTFVFCIRRADYNGLNTLCEKRGETLKVLKRKGLYWTGKQLLERPVLLLGMTLILSAVLYLPSRVFFVRVEGNAVVPARRILAAAEESGIGFGASRRQVCSEKVKNALLSAVPELQWAGVNTSGCLATISVRERAKPEDIQPRYEVSSIVAARDGYILSGTVTSGNAQFQVGQTVKAGQVLVSGYTDCGICIRAVKSEAEIFARTNHSLRVVTPSKWLKRGELTDKQKKISVLLGKKRINLWKGSGNSALGCGRIYEEYYATLPGGFQLPFALCVETLTVYNIAPEARARLDAVAVMTEFADSYLSQQMVAGRIRNRSEVIFPEAEIYSLDGDYSCTEMIGRVRREQIGDKNGKNS